jgi:hypothetical protein
LINNRGAAIASPVPAIDRRVLWLAMAAYVALTVTLALNHVMWRDEVRALSVAIHSASWSDLWQNLHTEGHPIVWYALLRLGYGLTHSMAVMPALALMFTAATAYLILRFAPFPVWARLCIVFGAFLGYEFSVVARNYGVAILLMIVACILFRRRRERPFPLAITLAVMANTSVHAALGAVVICLVWAMDLLNPEYRKEIGVGWGLGLLIVLGAVAIAIVSAKPLPTMAFAPDLSSFDYGKLLRKILKDPGSSIAGSSYADVAAAGELPWSRLGIDPALMSRIIVDVALASLAWSLRKNRACLIAMLAAIVGYSVLFRGAYTPALRHEGVLFFVLVSLCWIAATEPGETSTPRGRTVLALGMLPLLVTQTLTLPVLARRFIVHPQSSSKLFADLIHRTPRYRNAILMSEPDYNLESMPYYVTNPVFMPRQREFHYRVYFDRTRRQQRFTLGELVGIADSLSCKTGRPALVAISYPKVFTDSSGNAHLAYRGAEFLWDPADKAKLFSRGREVASFQNAADENYRIFDIEPRVGEGCMSPSQIP